MLINHKSLKNESMSENYYKTIKRILDICLTLIALTILLPFHVILAIVIKVSSEGPVIYWSRRIGVNNTEFAMPKYRSMYVETPELATHLLSDADTHLTPIGKFLRSSSIDELPQLICILRGDMSIVGPRPALHNQQDLKAMRTECCVHTLKPGLTGLAQISGRDDLSLSAKVDLDKEYLDNRSITFDLKIIFLTIVKIFSRTGVSH